MIPSAIRERLQQEPFQPFIIRSSSGDAVRVASAGLCILMKSEVFVAAPNSDSWKLLPYLHIAGVESDTNGRGRRTTKRARK
jgi:hypothetical protein